MAIDKAEKDDFVMTKDESVAARDAKIRAAVNRGYQSGNEHRKIRSSAHMQFLINSGEKIPS